MAIRAFQSIHPQLGANVYVDEMALVLGKVSIGDDSSVWPMTVVRGDVHSIRIGARTNIQDSSVLHVTADNQYNPGGHALTVGDDVTIGHGVILHACTVEDLCLVGMNATILDGVVIKKHTIVAAGSLVPPGKVLDSGFLWIGSPARKARALTEKEISYLSFSAKHYVELKNQHIRK